MQTRALDHHHHHQHPRLDTPQNSLNQRRGLSDLARFSIDLTWARAESEQAIRARAYPSPPMSGSPPLPPKPSHEAGERSQGSYRTSHDAYHRVATTTPPHGVDMRVHSRAPPPPSQQYTHPHHQPPSFSHTMQGSSSRPYGSEPHDRFSYPSYGRPEDQQYAPSAGHMATYPPPSHLQGPPAMAGYAPYLPPLPGPSSMQQGYPSSPRASAPAQIPSPVPGPPGSSDSVPPYASPKSQRKTKGHVASACVPCKRAHLRCDSQRPCSRCLSNGKEDACVDVQHKKRGRPRLREERDLRYELSGRGASGGHSTEPSSRRPVPTLYGQPSASMGSGYGVSTRRGQSSSYRVLKSQPADPIVPRFIERGSASDANVYPAPLSISTRALEPAVFLTTDLEMAKASNTFLEAIGRHSVKGLTLLDVISPMERERVISLQRQMHDERERKDPQYLPPIFVKRDEERVIQSLGLSADDLSRYAMDWHEYLTFSSTDGQQRTFPVHMGLAKQDSIYFIVLLLHVAMRPSFGHPTPSPHSSFGYQPMQHAPPQHQMFSQPTPVSATFDVGRPRMPSDSGILPHRPTPSGGPSPMLSSGLSPSISSAYGPSPGRSEYSTGPPSYQTPRSELVSGPLPHRQPQPAPGGSFQLPPIRNQQDPMRRGEGPPTSRDDKSRVDIGGLIDSPEPPRKMY